MTNLIGLILIFVNTSTNMQMTSKITLYPTREACETALPGIVAYQRGKQDAIGKGYGVTGWCVAIQSLEPTT